MSTGAPPPESSFWPASVAPGPGSAAKAPGLGEAPPSARALPLGLTNWVGWRLRVLMAFALAACVAVFLLMRWLAETPQLGVPTQADQTLELRNATGAVVGRWQLDAPGTLPRWQPDAAARQAALDLQRGLHAAVEQGPVRSIDARGTERSLSAHARGYAGLGAWFWPLVALALLLVLLGGVVVLAQPHTANALFALVAWAQALALLQQAALTLPGLLVSPTLLALDLPLRAALDLLSCAAVVHALLLFPRRQPRARAIALAAWGLSLGVLAAAWWLPGTWWWLQGALVALALLACWVTRRARQGGPVQRQTQALVLAGVAGLLLLTLTAAWASSALPGREAARVALGAAVPLWQAFTACLLLAPLMLRSRQVMREFALLASITVVAASLDLLFVALFSLSPFSSLALVVFIALGLYAGLRQWLFDRLTGATVLTTERVFEQLYRAAREVQSEPDRLVEELARLLRELFEPLEVLHSTRPVRQSRLAGGGGSLLVPVPSLAAALAAAAPPTAPGLVVRTTPGTRRIATLVLRHARKGQRVFVAEDAKLADRMVEQLRRAVAYDLAVERGRGEERLRIAQDLHDDIGARLLTLMYKAPNAEMEDYLRHTLKDLKTLTRGLAAGEHQLLDAAAEWRADIEQRCSAARVELDWAVQADEDVKLGVVAWSGLTRVLRELVSNVLHHARATRLTVRVRLLQGEFTLRVSDDGQGGAPETWSQGLGLAGVRKRVKLLGGSVRWRRDEPRGITCEVRLQGFGKPG